MRISLLFAVLAMLLVSTHAWQPKWKDWEKAARQHIEEAKTHLSTLKKHLPTNMQHMVDQAMQKLEQHQVKKDVHHAMEKLEKDLKSKWQNLAATEGLHVRNKEALEALMKHMMLSQARQNMDKATVMETYAHHLATHLMGENRAPQDIKALGSNLSSLAHNYIRKFMDGAQAIMHKNGVNLNKENVQKVLHHAAVEATKGHDIMGALMAEMKKMGVNTADLDVVVKDQLQAHFDRLRTAGIAEVQKLLAAHKVTTSVSNLIAALKLKGKEMMEKMKAMHAAESQTTMHKLADLAKKAFKNMKSGNHHNLMMKLHLIVRPAMDAHIHMVANIFKKHQMGTSHVIVRYTIYHRIKQEVEDDDHHRRHHHHHHHWWKSKPLRMGLIIGGSIFGVVLLVVGIIVLVHTLKERRRTPRKKAIIGEEKSSLPYSVMDDDASKA